MATVVKAMAQPDSGLEIRDRMWLKITIPNAFIGKFTSLLIVSVQLVLHKHSGKPVSSQYLSVPTWSFLFQVQI